MAPLVAELLRAQCTTIEGARMLFRGFERIGNQLDEIAPVRRQEWAVEVMVEQPKPAPNDQSPLKKMPG